MTECHVQHSFHTTPPFWIRQNDPADKLNQSIKIMVVKFACRRAAQPDSPKQNKTSHAVKNRNTRTNKTSERLITILHSFTPFAHSIADITVQLYFPLQGPSSSSGFIGHLTDHPASHEYDWKPTSGRCIDNVGPELVRCADTSDSRSRWRLCRKGAVSRRGRLVVTRLL